MDFQQNIISPETNCLNSSASNRYKDVIETVFSRLNEHLLKLMDNMLISIEENLLVQANKKQTDKENKKYLERSKIFHKIGTIFWLRGSNEKRRFTTCAWLQEKDNGGVIAKMTEMQIVLIISNIDFPQP